ncbi:MAG: flagellar protein FlgN [Oscillibacter sp.]|nr:flagellar protein FlgN [Oscillibacter sp.]
MADQYRSYLDLLEALREKLAELSDLARLKTAVVRNDDLLALDEVLRQEQAITLSFRGLDQKREKLLGELGASDLPLASLPDCYPAAMQAEARQVVAALQEQFRAYRTEADAARSTLEGHLHEVEKILEEAGATPPSGPGYTPPETEPPPNMKTDFRA